MWTTTTATGAATGRPCAERGEGGQLIAAIAPSEQERLIFKPRYSAFDHTPLELLLRELGVERLLLAGGSTEGCIVQSGIDARELGFKITILTCACATVGEEREEIALRYAESVAGIFLAKGVSDAREKTEKPKPSLRRQCSSATWRRSRRAPETVASSSPTTRAASSRP
jgi:nicotinamidase-related amidase